MSRGMTIAELVQQVFYAIYKVRLDVTVSPDAPDAFHAATDKFKEVVMEANFVLQELQKEQDWNWLRERWNVGTAANPECGGIAEFTLPEWAYRICTGYGDAVRLHRTGDWNVYLEAPFTSARTGSTTPVAMFDLSGRVNVADNRLLAFVVGDTLTFNRPFCPDEIGMTIETDVVRYLEPLHICGSEEQPCARAYQERIFTEIPDPYYMVVRTAAKRAEGDPSVADRVMSLGDEAMKLLSAMRENDSSKTTPDSYTTSELGYTRVF